MSAQEFNFALKYLHKIRIFWHQILHIQAQIFQQQNIFRQFSERPKFKELNGGIVPLPLPRRHSIDFKQ